MPGDTNSNAVFDEITACNDTASVKWTVKPQRARAISYFDDKLFIDVTTSPRLTSEVFNISEMRWESWRPHRLFGRFDCKSCEKWSLPPGCRNRYGMKLEVNTTHKMSGTRKMCIWTHYSAACCIVENSFCWLDVIPAVRSKQKSCELLNRGKILRKWT